MNNRIILNIDDCGVHVRTNECTIYHSEMEEIVYHCKPIKTIKNRLVKFIIKLIIKL